VAQQDTDLLDGDTRTASQLRVGAAQVVRLQVGFTVYSFASSDQRAAFLDDVVECRGVGAFSKPDLTGKKHRI
jgi:hypothetical protein